MSIIRAITKGKLLANLQQSINILTGTIMMRDQYQYEFEALLVRKGLLTKEELADLGKKYGKPSE